MSRILSASSGYKKFVERLTDEASAKLKVLLETKHLYQKVRVEMARLQIEIGEMVALQQVPAFKELTDGLLQRETISPTLGKLYSTIGGNQVPALCIPLENVRMYCKACRRREPFVPVWHVDVTNEMLKPTSAGRGTVNVLYTGLPRHYCLAFKCQGCNSSPELLLVRLDSSWNLVLEGRSPIEEVEVPAYIPKAERLYYTDAVVAAQSGKSLAGIFYLRTFLEQFARRQTNTNGKVTGEDLMDAYARLLPDVQRGQMPSLREWYEKLSEAIHAADDDTKLYDDARAAIDTHFDFRRLFKIEDGPRPEQPKVAPAAAR